jgi:hypothetical protein
MLKCEIAKHFKNVKGYLKFSGLGLILSILLVALAACGDSPTATPSATVAPPTAPDIAKQAATQLAAQTGLHFTFDVKQGKAQVIPGVDIKTANGDYSKPDKFSAGLKVKVLGGTVDASTVGITSKQWVLIKGLKDSWTLLPSGTGFDASILFDPQKGLGATVQKTKDLKLIGGETVDATDCWHIQGVAAGADIIALIPVGTGKNDVTFDMWVGKSDMLPRQVILQEVVSTQDGGLWEIHFSDFNKTVIITPPV